MTGSLNFCDAHLDLPCLLGQSKASRREFEAWIGQEIASNACPVGNGRHMGAF
jgi:hypothetical protein